jgi:hypothetical protein
MTVERKSEWDLVVTRTFNGPARIVIHDRYPTKEALDAAMASQSTSGFSKQLSSWTSFLPPDVGQRQAGIPDQKNGGADGDLNDQSKSRRFQCLA